MFDLNRNFTIITFTALSLLISSYFDSAVSIAVLLACIALYIMGSFLSRNNFEVNGKVCIILSASKQALTLMFPDNSSDRSF